ncbi:MAG TPA: hypothetical protein DET40_15390 [Lentisphaeria bacterium]|nr:MAG: hypothetical protein A2X45_05360 [Lentisphaerae bacterium GWF2_50_93]HCE44923.1 hypothetical protein [Lentisphaeria bacterium]
MKKTVMVMLAGLAMVLITSSAMAETRSFNLSLTPDVAVYPRSDVIEGVTLSVWGENQQSSLALGLANGSFGQSTGMSVGMLNYTDNYMGLQWGLVNYTKGDSSGWQGGFIFAFLASGVNYTAGTMKGLFTGVVNYAGRLKGLQLGVVNYVEDSDAGVQIGLFNIIHSNKNWFSDLPGELAPAMILVNWSF